AAGIDRSAPQPVAPGIAARRGRAAVASVGRRPSIAAALLRAHPAAGAVGAAGFPWAPAPRAGRAEAAAHTVSPLARARPPNLECWLAAGPGTGRSIPYWLGDRYVWWRRRWPIQRTGRDSANRTESPL